MPSIAALWWNSQERRLRLIWRLLLQTAIYYLGNIAIITAIGVMFMNGWFGAGLMDRTATTLADIEHVLAGSPLFLVVITVVSAVVIGISVWFSSRYLDKRPFVEYGFHFQARWWQDLGFGLALGAFLMTAIFAVEWSAGWITMVGTLHAGAFGQPFFIDLLASLLLFLCVGVYEELLFRGYRLRNLAEGIRLGPIQAGNAVLLAWLVSSVWFGLAHRNNPNATLVSNINLMLAGLFLGLGYILTGELAISIGLHITWNFFQGNVYGFPVSGTSALQTTFIAIEQGGPQLWTGGAFGPEAGLLGIGAMLVGTLLILGWVRVRYGRVTFHHQLALYGGHSEPHSF